MKKTPKTVARLTRFLLSVLPLCLGFAAANAQVAASFDASSVYPCAGETVTFTNTSIGAVNYVWGENGTPFSNSLNATRTFTTPGSYLITLIASDGVSNDTANTIVVVNPGLGGSLLATDASCFGIADGGIDLTPSGGTPNLAICMDGINDYVSADEISNVNFSGGITIECWVKPEQTWTSGDGMVAAFNSVGGGNHILISYNTSLQKFLYFDDAVGNQIPTAVHPRGQWYHLAVTITSSNQGRMYVNGVLIRSFSTGTSWIPMGGRFSFGQEWDGTVTSQHFNGCMDEARIWNAALTQATVQSNFNNSCASIDPNHPNINSLVSYYSFNEGGGTFTFDRSGNGYHGNYNGILWSPPSGNNFGCFAQGTGFAYDWSNSASTEDLSGLAAATYSVDVIDGAGCTFADSATVNEPPEIIFSLSSSPSDTICDGDTTTILTSGAYTFTYSPAASLSASTGSSVQAFPSSSTTYTVIAEDGFGCQDTAAYAITVNPLPTPAVSGPDSICAGDTAVITASGGSQYLWNTGDPTATISVAPPSDSTYSVTVTDLNGCSADAALSVTVLALPTVGIIGPGALCLGDSALLEAIGTGAALWSTGSTSDSITVQPATTTTYSVLLTDSLGCANSDIIEIVVNALPIVSISGDTVVCEGDTATLTATGGGSYAWSNAANTSSISVTPSTATTYSVVVTDSNSCSAGDSISVAVNVLPVVGIMGADTLCEGDSTSLMATGAASYLWSTGATSTIVSVGPVVTTTYSVTGTDSNSCLATAALEVVVNPLPLLVIAGDTSICEGDSTSLEVTGANSYLWSTGSTMNGISVGPSVNTAYTVTGTDLNGCSASESVGVTVNPLPMPIVTQVGGVLSPGPGYATYQWFLNGSPIAGATAQDYNPAQGGNYSVMVTDSNGCSGTSDIFTGTSEIGWLSSASIFPNPNNGRFTLEIEADRSHELQVVVTTMHGQRIFEIADRAYAGRWQREINLGEVAKGLYMVSIESGGSRMVRKIVIE